MGVIFAHSVDMDDAAHATEATLGRLLRTLLPLAPDEAAAVASGVFDARVREDSRTVRLPIEALRVAEDGTLVRTTSPPPTEQEKLDEAGLVLRAALPDPGAPTDSPAADLLRHLARGAMFTGEPAVFQTTDQFREVLRPFSSPDPGAVRRALFARWRERQAADVVPASPEPEFDGPQHLVDVHVDAPTPWDLVEPARPPR